MTPVSPTDLDYLSNNGFVLRTTQDVYEKEVAEVGKLALLVTQVGSEKASVEQAGLTLQEDERKEHSFLFHFEAEEKKADLRQRVQSESAASIEEEAELSTLEANVNRLIQEKSMIDRMVAYDGGYLSLTGVGTITLSDLNVRNYRVADMEFSEFVTEMRATYSELRSIVERATAYVNLLRPSIPKLSDEDSSISGGVRGGPPTGAPSLLWAVAIGLAKLQGDANQIGERFVEAFNALRNFDSTIPNKLMAAEIITAVGGRNVPSLESPLKNLGDLDRQIRGKGVPKELSAGAAATILAGQRFDGTYPLDQFTQFYKVTQSCEAASILAVMNLPYDELFTKFQEFRNLFNSWGYMRSDDTEIASAFLSIQELNANEVQAKLEYIVEQLKNYLEYPLVAAAILGSIPVFEAHEALDLMEKAVTLLSGCAVGLERSELVALAVRMIHGVRNELVKDVDSTARIAQTPVQFTYGLNQGLYIRFFPVIVAHSSYHATFSAMGGFHPAHSHGIGGFAG